MSNYCGIDANEKATTNEEPKRIKWTKEQRTLIEKLTAEKHAKLRQARAIKATTGDESAAAYSQKLAEIEETLVRAAGDIIQLDPSQYDKWASLVSAKLGWRRANPINPSLVYSQAGEVREGLKDARRVAQNLVADASHIRMLDGVKRFDEIYREIMKPVGISGDDARELFNELIETGAIPKNNNIYGKSEGVELINSLRYNDTITKARGYGLSDDNIQTLLRASSDVHSSFDEMRVIAESVNHNIEELTNLGYFPRVATRDFELRLRRAVEEDTSLVDVVMSEGVEEVKKLNPLSSAWQKSRKYNYFVPADLEVAAQLLNTTSDDIAERLLNPRQWMEFLSESATSSQIKTLTDIGVLEKLPMTSREVFENMVDEYQLPYKHINEMFKLDPHVAAEEYSRVLKNAVGNSAMLNTVVKDGLSAGWALTKKQLDEIPQEFKKNFVPLKFQKLDEFLTPEQLDEYGSIYTHRVVADQWRSMLEISMSPGKMGAFAASWASMSSFLNKSVLASRNILYVGTNFLSGFVLTNAVGANIFTVPHAMMDLNSYLARGLEGLDGVKPYAKIEGQWLTKREYFKNFLLRRGSDITPGTVSSSAAFGDESPFSSFRSITSLADAGSAKRALEYLWSYSTSFKDPVKGMKGAGEYVGSLLNEATDNFFSPFAKLASYIDTIYKWNAYTSLVERNGAANVFNKTVSVGTLERPQSFTNWKELGRHIDDYFFTFDDPGTTTRFVGRYIRPFAGWSMQSTPAMLRFAMRRPQKFIAYNRLLTLYNRSNDELKQSELTDWQDDEYPIILRNDGLSGGTTVLFPHTFDPITDTINTIDGVGRSVDMFLGRPNVNERDKRAMLTGKDATQRMLTEFFNDTYWAKPAGIALGIDSFTGEKLDASKYNSYLGVEMKPLAEALLGMYAPFDALNRANPGDVFGRKEYNDYLNNNIVKEKPSIFGAQRTNSDAQQLAWESAANKGDWSTLLLMASGARVRIIDRARNTQMTLDEIRQGIDDLQKSNVRAARELTMSSSKLSEDENNKRKQRLTESLTAEYQLKYDYARLTTYMAANKIPPRRVLNELRDRSINVGDMEPVGQTQRLQLDTEFKQRIKELNR